MPEAGIGADVMTGFPGETDELFEESRQFIESMPYTYLHVFTYSERPGTVAASMPGVVPVPVRKERNRVLRELAAAKNRAFRERMVGFEVSAVTIEPLGLALTDNYVKASLGSCLIAVRIAWFGCGFGRSRKRALPRIYWEKLEQTRLKYARPIMKNDPILSGD